MPKSIQQVAQAAIIAALYFVLTAYVFQPISFLPVQFRVAEALMLLPALIPAAVPGVFMGCLLANLLNPASLGPVDILLGSLATLLAALVTAGMGRRLGIGLRKWSWSAYWLWLLPLPTVLFNALIVGSYLPFLLTPGEVHAPLLLSSIALLGLGELVVCYALGLPLLMALRGLPFFQKRSELRR